jgi:small neutral amino acid transporter SnatA (MarC family)
LRAGKTGICVMTRLAGMGLAVIAVDGVSDGLERRFPTLPNVLNWW